MQKLQDNISTTNIQNKKGITGSTLKIIAIITMLIDHSAAILIDGFFKTKGYNLATISQSDYIQFLNQYSTLYYIDLLMRMVGRIAFPIFIFLLIEGATHTKNKFKYAIRLSLFAFVSEIPFDLAFNHSFFYFDYQNVFFTLAIGLFMIIGFDFISNKLNHKFLLHVLSILGLIAPTIFIMWRYRDSIVIQVRSFTKNQTLGSWNIYLVSIAILLIITILYLALRKKRYSLLAAQKASSNLLILFSAVTLALILKTDYSDIGILAIAIMYMLRRLKTQSFLLGCFVLIISQPFEIPALLGLIPIRKYNGLRGLQLKYAFYIFYPLHLLILYIIYLVLL